MNGSSARRNATTDSNNEGQVTHHKVPQLGLRDFASLRRIEAAKTSLNLLVNSAPAVNRSFSTRATHHEPEPTLLRVPAQDAEASKEVSFADRSGLAGTGQHGKQAVGKPCRREALRAAQHGKDLRRTWMDVA